MFARVALSVLAWLSCHVVVSAAEPLLPLGDFFRRPAIADAVVSPDGSHVAAMMPGGPQGRQRLVVIDLKALSASKVLAGFTDADIVGVRWVNDRRLVYSIADRQSPDANQPGAGLFSIDRDGATAPRRLIKSRQYFVSEPSRIGDRELSVYHHFVDVLRDGSDDVIVEKFEVDGRGDVDGTSLWRLDTVSGRVRRLATDAPADVFGWALDAKGVPRVAITNRDGHGAMYCKPKADAAGWTLLRRFATYTGAGAPQVVGVDADDRLLAVTRVDGSDTASLARIDPQEGGAGKVEPMVSLAGFDFHGQLLFGARGQLLGVHYLSDGRGTYWYEPALRDIQTRLDALLPATTNRIDCGDCNDLSQLLVRSSSDRQPAVYYLYEPAEGRLETLARSRPWIDPRSMARRDFQHFAARDGLQIPVHVTRPSGAAGAAPAVVLVHGGPWLRGGEWQWDAESQFLASRGYVVIEPEFRGSTGFGRRLFRAGFKQWGLAMQDDVADAARWAVQQGYADPKRIAIGGASYGGYATLMGLIRDPALFRCGFEWVGVTDIDLMYSIRWSDSSEAWKRYGMPALIGDRDKDAAQLTATSPLRQAARLHQPLLMAYGTDDYRVPIDHGTAMRDALRGSNPNVEFVTYAGEGHRWMLESTTVDFFGRVESFLAKNLAPQP